MTIDIYNLRRNIAVKPISKKLVTDVRFYRDHRSMFTIEQKNRRGHVLQLEAFQNHELAGQLAKWQNRGFTIS